MLDRFVFKMYYLDQIKCDLIVISGTGHS